jgi:hypothetical protein
VSWRFWPVRSGASPFRQRSTRVERRAPIRVGHALALSLHRAVGEERVGAGPHGSIAHAAGLAAFVAWGILVVQRRGLRRPSAALLLAALFVLWCAATLLWTLDPAATKGRALTFCELFAMFVLVWDQCRTPARQVQLLAALRVRNGGCFRGGHTRATFTISRHTICVTAASGFDPNDFGMVLALGVPLALYLALRARGWARWLWFASLPITISAILLTAIARVDAGHFRRAHLRALDRGGPAAWRTASSPRC